MAIAACYAQRVHELKRVFIIDFDVHHGNGTNVILFVYQEQADDQS